MAGLPEGTVTFLFSDVEGSTQLLEAHGELMGPALARHHEIFDRVVAEHAGTIFETVGDAVYAVFAYPADATAAAIQAHRSLAAQDWDAIQRLAVRIAIHTGPVERRGDHYFGSPLFRAARLQALAHGEQTLLSAATVRLLEGKLPAGAALRDLGSHRLKDLREREQVFQLVHPELRADFPPLRSLDARPNNLPEELSSLVGRDREASEVDALVTAHRLVTLLGPGGIGKTRLALEVAARRLDAHQDGVFFVDLAPLGDPELTPLAIASTLGLREQPGLPIASLLAAYLDGKQVLLVLDNLEHLLPAAGASISELQRASPTLRVLATSRVPLHIRGEREYLVAALGTAVADATNLPPAVALFYERARNVRPDLDLDDANAPLVAAICARLDGLPLAIELAAARMRVFSLNQLHARLARRLPVLSGRGNDSPERQRTMRSTIAWSEELLSGPERRLFARLGVFGGAFTLEAAEAVAGAGLDREVYEGVTTLLEHSLLRQLPDTASAPRYAMLETIREYALERLEGSAEADAVRGRHARRLLELAARSYALRSGDGSRAIDELLELEHDDLRASLRWLHESGHADLLIKLVSFAARFWAHHGHITDGLEWAVRALETAPDGDLLARGRIQRSLWSLNHFMGHGAQGYAAIVQSVASFEAAGDEQELGWSLALLGNELQVRGARDEARAALERAISIAERCGDDITRRRARNSLALSLVEAGQVEAGERALSELFAEAVREDDLASIIVVGADLASVRLEMGKPDAAQEPARRSVEATRRSGRVDGWSLVGLGCIQTLQGEYSEARASFREALKLTQRAGDRNTLAGLLKGWAGLEAREGDPAIAAYCLAAGIELQRQGDYVRTPAEAAFDESEMKLARERLAEAAFVEASQRGARASYDELISLLNPRIDRDSPTIS